MDMLGDPKNGFMNFLFTSALFWLSVAVMILGLSLVIFAIGMATKGLK